MLDPASRKFTSICSSDLKVGDIVMCHNGDTFSADFALLTSSNEGEAFIKTSSLDGEKNLKKRVQCKDTEEIFKPKTLHPEEYLKIRGELTLELPNKDLHSFKGTLNINQTSFTLSEKQLLLKGASLANTDWVVALCCYTGEETKIMLNSQPGR